MSTMDLIQRLANEHQSLTDCYRVMSDAIDQLEWYEKRCAWYQKELDATKAERERAQQACEQIGNHVAGKLYASNLSEPPVLQIDWPASILCDGRILQAGRHQFVLKVDYDAILSECDEHETKRAHLEAELKAANQSYDECGQFIEKQNALIDALRAEVTRLRDTFERIHAVSNIPDHDCYSICVEILNPSPQQKVDEP